MAAAAPALPEHQLEMALGLANGGSELAIRTRLKLQEAVCKVVLLGGASGSGSLVEVGGKACVLTNHHVLRSASEASTAEAMFEDRDDARATVKLDPDALFVTDAALDFSFVAVKEHPVCGARRLEPVVLSGERVAAGDALYIVQFPRGGEKKDAIQRVLTVTDTSVSYLLDTDYGSSGSPVFKEGRAVALHRARDPHAKANLGVLMSAVLQRLGELLLERDRAAVPAEAEPPPPPPPQPPQPPPAPAAEKPAAGGLHAASDLLSVGDLWEALPEVPERRVTVQWRGGERRLQADGRFLSVRNGCAFPGLAVAYNARAGVHRVEYDDGGVELLDSDLLPSHLPRPERPTPPPVPPPRPPPQTRRLAAGLYAASEVDPDGWEALAASWRVRVRWSGGESRRQAAGHLVRTERDTAWSGTVVARHAARGLHRILYDDGAEELADLTAVDLDNLSGGGAPSSA